MRASEAPRPPQALPPALALESELGRRSFRDFITLAWSVVEPARPLVPGWYLDAMALHLQAVGEGQLTRLLINCPPGVAKSLLCSVLYPAWRWARDPAWRGIFASHSHTMALRDSVRCRRLLESQWYRERFAAGWALREDENRADSYENTHSGRRLAVSVGGGLTGARADGFVVDDPHNQVDIHSKPARESVIGWFGQSLSSRLDDLERAGRVVVMQRLHAADLAGHLLGEGGWTSLVLPAEFSPARRCVTHVQRPSGQPVELWRDPREADGELLFPELLGAAALDQARKDLLSGFSTQYNQSPVDHEGGMLLAPWWRFHKPDGVAAARSRRPAGCTDLPAAPLPATLDRIIIAGDLAFRDTKSADYVVLLVVGAVGANRYVLEMVRKRLNFTATVAALRELVARWEAQRVVIEARANGDALLSVLKDEVVGIIGVEPKGGKEARLAAVSPQIEAGQVYLPEGAAWLEDFVCECSAFPRGTHDDIPDALAYALAALHPADPLGLIVDEHSTIEAYL